MKRIAVFPGSFDPITIGHKNIVERALPLFDTIIIAIGTNAEKTTLFSIDERISQINNAFNEYPQVVVEYYSGLTIDFCKQKEARFILRGLRNTLDFEYEKSISQMNKDLSGGIETVLFFTDAECTCISSSAIRDLIKCKKDYSRYVPFTIPKTNDID